MMLEHPKIVPRSRKTLDFSRVGVAWGGSVFHHVVVVVEVLVKMYNGAQGAISGGSGGLRGAQGGPLGGGTGELREAASRQLVSTSSSSSSSSSSRLRGSSSSSSRQDVGPIGTCKSNPTLAPLEPEFGPFIGAELWLQRGLFNDAGTPQNRT